MTTVFAGLRYPVSITVAALLTAGLFTLLWAFTDKTFDVLESTPVKIEFSRVVQETVTETRRQQKVEREPPEAVIEVPSFADRITPSVGPVTVTRLDPVVDVGRGISVSGSDHEAVPLVRIAPTYPTRAAANGTEGWVRVQFDIAESGSVRNVVAVASEPGTVFDEAAVDAVARWRYNPSIVNGQAVERVGMQTLLRFSLEE